jgi:non-ribosomal peptide synthetase component F
MLNSADQSHSKAPSSSLRSELASVAVIIANFALDDTPGSRPSKLAAADALAMRSQGTGDDTVHPNAAQALRSLLDAIESSTGEEVGDLVLASSRSRSGSASVFLLVCELITGLVVLVVSFGDTLRAARE